MRQIRQIQSAVAATTDNLNIIHNCLSTIDMPLLQQLEVHNGYIYGSKPPKWKIPNESSSTFGQDQYVIIPVQSGDVIQIQRYDINSFYTKSVYLLITDYQPIHNQLINPVIENTTIQEAGAVISTITVPSVNDAIITCYLYLLLKRDGIDRTPTLLTINDVDYLNPPINDNCYKACTKMTQLPYEYGLDNILCIGDSLTMGSYPNYNTPIGWTGGTHFIKQSYPYFLSRILNTTVTNAGFSGFSAYDWYHGSNEDWTRPNYNYTDYDVVTIWLGTNKGLDNSFQYSATAPEHANETILPLINFRDANDPTCWDTTTQVGSYCQIIQDIKTNSPHTLIVLLTTFAGNTVYRDKNNNIDSESIDNSTIRHVPKEDCDRIYEIANYFNLPVVPLSDLQYTVHPELHGIPVEIDGSTKVDKVHLRKNGHLFVAHRIIQTLHDWFDYYEQLAEDDPTQSMFSNFGVTRRTDM